MSYKIKGSVTGLEPNKHYTKEEIEATGHSVERLQSLGALEAASGKPAAQEDPRDPELATGAPPPLNKDAEEKPKRKTGDAAAAENPPSPDDRPGKVTKVSTK